MTLSIDKVTSGPSPTTQPTFKRRQTIFGNYNFLVSTFTVNRNVGGPGSQDLSKTTCISKFGKIYSRVLVLSLRNRQWNRFTRVKLIAIATNPDDGSTLRREDQCLQTLISADQWSEEVRRGSTGGGAFPPWQALTRNGYRQHSRPRFPDSSESNRRGLKKTMYGYCRAHEWRDPWGRPAVKWFSLTISLVSQSHFSPLDQTITQTSVPVECGVLRLVTTVTFSIASLLRQVKSQPRPPPRSVCTSGYFVLY